MNKTWRMLLCLATVLMTTVFSLLMTWARLQLKTHQVNSQLFNSSVYQLYSLWIFLNNHCPEIMSLQVFSQTWSFCDRCFPQGLFLTMIRTYNIPLTESISSQPQLCLERMVRPKLWCCWYYNGKKCSIADPNLRPYLASPIAKPMTSNAWIQ